MDLGPLSRRLNRATLMKKMLVRGARRERQKGGRRRKKGMSFPHSHSQRTPPLLTSWLRPLRNGLRNLLVSAKGSLRIGLISKQAVVLGGTVKRKGHRNHWDNILRNQGDRFRNRPLDKKG